MKHIVNVQWVITAFLLLLAQPAGGQISHIYYLKIADETGGKDSLVFGNHEYATFGVDAALGENSAPPLPPGFSVIFGCPRVPAPPDWGIGLLKRDYREFPADIHHIDSFYVQFRNDNTDSASVAAGVWLRWPAGLIPCWCDSMLLVIPGDSVDLPARGINMANQNNLKITSPFDEAGWNPRAPSCVIQIYQFGSNRVIDADCSDNVRETSRPVSRSFALEQNYPNPYNPSTSISFRIPARSHVTLTIYNMLGQQIAQLVDEERPAGAHTVEWNATNCPSGVYVYRLQATSLANPSTLHTVVRKMILLR